MRKVGGGLLKSVLMRGEGLLNYGLMRGGGGGLLKSVLMSGGLLISDVMRGILLKQLELFLVDIENESPCETMT